MMEQNNATQQRVLSIRSRIETACQHANRKPSSVTLISASKTVETARLRPFLEAGLTDLGENYVQEGVAKIEELQAEYSAVRWHLIGSLQSNKAREAVRYFDVIHSVDRVSLAKALDKEAAKLYKVQDILLQVNIGAEDSKSGCAPDEIKTLLARCRAYSHLRVLGLMTLPPFHENPEKTRPYFRRMRELLKTAQQSTPVPGAEFKELSMGMSNGFKIAIEEGATMVRVGTALFGERASLNHQ